MVSDQATTTPSSTMMDEGLDSYPAERSNYDQQKQLAYSRYQRAEQTFGIEHVKKSKQRSL